MSDGTTPDRGRTAGRSYGIALALIALGGAGLLVAYGMTWGSGSIPLVAGTDGPTALRQFTGRDLFPAAAVSGWVCLAGLAGVVATRSWGRILVGVAILVAGVAGAAGAIAFAVRASAAIDDAASGIVGAPVAVSSTITPWWVLALLAGAVAGLGALWTVVRGRRWPTLGARYERAARGRPAMSAWDAQDLGQDPTDDLVE